MTETSPDPMAWRTQMPADAYQDKASLAFFRAAGFQFWHTGGGCTAYGRDVDGKHQDDEGLYILVTGVDTALHPQDDECELWVGIYDCLTLSDGEMFTVSRDTPQETWRATIEMANYLTKKHCEARGLKPAVIFTQTESDS